MRHLIVESCISRNLLDTSAYYWPGYINGHVNSMSNALPSQLAGWSSFMKGAPLTQSLVNMLVTVPASRCVSSFPSKRSEHNLPCIWTCISHKRCHQLDKKENYILQLMIIILCLPTRSRQFFFFKISS